MVVFHYSFSQWFEINNLVHTRKNSRGDFPPGAIIPGRFSSRAIFPGAIFRIPMITGDFNYKNINWENQHAMNGQNYFLDIICTIQECFLFQHVTEPTGFRENEIRNLLDLNLSSDETMIQDITYHPHLAKSIIFVLNLNYFFPSKKRSLYQ